MPVGREAVHIRSPWLPPIIGGSDEFVAPVPVSYRRMSSRPMLNRMYEDYTSTVLDTFPSNAFSGALFVTGLLL